eukprot:Tamp_35502.p1 GENE.Tamp_35502~~Tamp_35502.p1  ORF type:complete len:111 (-),score=8.56 Tamp_35502:104-436(-)
MCRYGYVPSREEGLSGVPDPYADDAASCRQEKELAVVVKLMVMMSSVVLGAGVMARNALQLLESNIRVSLSHSLTHTHTHTLSLSLSQCPAPPGSEHWGKSLQCPPAPGI